MGFWFGVHCHIETWRVIKIWRLATTRERSFRKTKGTTSGDANGGTVRFPRLSGKCPKGKEGAQRIDELLCFCVTTVAASHGSH